MSNYQVLVTCLEVVSATTRENSIVSGGGGGGYASSGSTYVAPVWISTRIQRTTEIWGKQTNGQEARFLIPGADLPIRQGHKLALLVGNGAVWAVKNFTTGETMWMADWQSFAGDQPRQVSKNQLITAGVIVSICSIPIAWAILQWFGFLRDASGFNFCVVFVSLMAGPIGGIVYRVNRGMHYRRIWTDSKARWEAYLHTWSIQLDQTQFQ